MGNDGGSIPRRDELVKLKKKKATAERDEQNKNKWTLCALSKQPLQQPIVADKLGYLYNKMAVLEALLEGSLPSEFSHIRKAKRDLIAINFTTMDTENTKFICPVTGLTVGGNYKFFAMKPCGCVIAERAMKELPDQKVCLSCSTPISDEDVLLLNPPEEQVADLRETLRTEKKSRKRKNPSTGSSKKQKKQKTDDSGYSSLAGSLVAPKDISAYIPKNADPSIYKSIFTPTAAAGTANPNDAFCGRS